MSLCSFDSDSHIFDVTPVENLFIEEFMLKAPGDFVKVYIFGLKNCYYTTYKANTYKDIAHTLQISVETVKNAFLYWSRQGLLSISGDEETPKIEYHNIKDVLYNNSNDNHSVLNTYQEFNENLQFIFKDRLLSPQEYLKIYDWIEIFNLPKEVVLMMIQFYVTKKGSRLSINYLDKIAKSWSEQGIDSLQKAEDYIKSCEDFYKDTIDILKYLGIRRLPSKAELDLLKKWKKSWGFDLDAILQACNETTKIQSPNMNYVDKILENLHQMGLHSKNEIQSYITHRRSLNSQVRIVLMNLGDKKTSPTPQHHSLYIKWTNKWGFTHECVLLACKYCVSNHLEKSFSSIGNILKTWLDNNITTEDSIKVFINNQVNVDNEINAILMRAGESRAVTESDRRLYNKWSIAMGLPFELILLAADYSTSAKSKLPFMNRILENWSNKNINTVKEAISEHKNFIDGLKINQAEKQSPNKKVDFTKYQQHDYEEDYLETLFHDVDEKEI